MTNLLIGTYLLAAFIAAFFLYLGNLYVAVPLTAFTLILCIYAEYKVNKEKGRV